MVKKKEWEYAEERKKLIKFVEIAMKKAKKGEWGTSMAMDIVDSIILSAFEYSNKEQEKRVLLLKEKIKSEWDTNDYYIKKLNQMIDKTFT